MTLALLAAAFAAAWRHMAYCPHDPLAGAGAAPPDPALQARLAEHVRQLAEGLGPRHLGAMQALDAADAYIQKSWRKQGLRPVGHPYQVDGRWCRNIACDLPGPTAAEDTVVVGAHYDSVAGSPGADDDAGGVAALLELPRLLGARSARRPVRLVAFVNEEDPYFGTAQMGSQVFADEACSRGEPIHAMISLDAIGYYSDARNSQGYPTALAFFFPDRGNFLSIVGNVGGRELVNRFHSYLAPKLGVPSLCVATFEWLEGIDWSDHQSFWKAGYPALMVTDTAVYRHPGYHTPKDLPATVDFGKLALVTAGLARAVQRLRDE
ncbi:MAG: M20/M25/M40 family metallo-hydrolase [Candidatus Wallbacteria bacterium]|nr:M20/M25/M40 family metallo-hydrolase [Candidatus Wallbacteria bacterium]